MDTSSPIVELGEEINGQDGSIELERDDLELEEGEALSLLVSGTKPVDQVWSDLVHLKIDMSRLSAPCSFSSNWSTSPASNHVP